MQVRGGHCRVEIEELEHVVPELGEEGAAARGEPAPRRRLGERIIEPGCREAEDLDRGLPGPPGKVAVGQDDLPRRIGDLRVQPQPAKALEEADVRVIDARSRERRPEGERHRERVSLVGEPLVPGAVRDGVEHGGELLQIARREREPGRGARVLASQRQRGEAEAGGVDPVVILQVLLHVPGVGQILRERIRLGADPSGDLLPVGVGERGVDPVVGDADAHQHVRRVEVGTAQAHALAEAPVGPAQIGEDHVARLGRVPRVLRELVPEGPDRDLVSEEARIVVVGQDRRRVVQVLTQDLQDVLRNRLVRRRGGVTNAACVVRREEDVRVGCAEQGEGRSED